LFLPLIIPIFDERDNDAILPLFDDFDSILTSPYPGLADIVAENFLPARILALIENGANTVKIAAGRTLVKLLQLSRQSDLISSQLVGNPSVIQAIFDLLESDEISDVLGLINGLMAILDQAERAGKKEEVIDFVLTIGGREILEEFACGNHSDHVRAALSILLVSEITCDAQNGNHFE
jgi:hypothetical protein